MREILYKNFYGGIAESLRDESNFKFDFAKHFDIWSDPKKLIPQKTIVANNNGFTAGSSGNRPANFMILNGQTSSDCVMLGKIASGVNNMPKLYLNSDSNADWLALTNAESTLNSLFTKMLIKYKTKYYGRNGQRIFSYAPATTTWVDDASGGTLLLSNSNDTKTNAIIGKSNGYLYFPTANLLHYFDGSTWGTALLSIPSDENIIGLANYGSYLAVLTDASFIYLWDFASILATEIIELPEGSYSNLGSSEGQLIAIGQKVTPTGSELLISQYGGGNAEVIFRKNLPDTVSVVQGIARSRYGKVFFAVNDSATDRKYQGIWCIGRHKAGFPMAVSIAFDYLESGGTASDIANFDIDFQHLYVVTIDYKIHKLSTTFAITAPISQVEFCRSLADDANMNAISVGSAYLPADGVVTTKIQKDEETLWTEVMKDSTDNSLGMQTDRVNQSAKTATITIATPGVVTCVNHGFGKNQAFKFSTTGALPTGITAGTIYYVSSTSLTTDTFKFATSPNGTVINTTGSQSGVHTITTEPATLPSFSEVAVRVESLGGGEITEVKFKVTDNDTIYDG